MAYIYLITNDINGKQYVGKTIHNNIQERWREHLNEYKQHRAEKRPLYDAMNKYGIEHFYIQEIEYVPSEINLEEREIYWIAQYNTYYDGYNATLGGDGKRILNYDDIKSYWDQGLNCKQISEKLKCCREQVSIVLREYYLISSDEIKQRQKNQQSMAVNQIDKNTNKILATFSSTKEAAKAMLEQHYTNCKITTGSTHICEVCKGKRKTFAGFKWNIVNLPII